MIRNSTELPDSGDYVDGESGFITTTEFGMRSTTREESTKLNKRVADGSLAVQIY